MRDPQMPYDSLKRFGVRGDIYGIDGRNHNRDVCDPRGVTSIATQDAQKRGAAFFRQLHSRHQIRTYIFFHTPPTHRQNKKRVFFTEVASLEPFAENGSPSLIVGASG